MQGSRDEKQCSLNRTNDWKEFWNTNGYINFYILFSHIQMTYIYFCTHTFVYVWHFKKGDVTQHLIVCCTRTRKMIPSWGWSSIACIFYKNTPIGGAKMQAMGLCSVVNNNRVEKCWNIWIIQESGLMNSRENLQKKKKNERSIKVAVSR